MVRLQDRSTKAMSGGGRRVYLAIGGGEFDGRGRGEDAAVEAGHRHCWWGSAAAFPGERFDFEPREGKRVCQKELTATEGKRGEIEMFGFIWVIESNS